MPACLRAPILGLALAAALLVGCGGDDEPEATKPFQPQASLTAVGGTQRTAKPEVVLRVEARRGDANIRAATVTLPSAFLVDQTAVRSICSERELEEARCAGRKRIGAARVVSPAYDGVLAGPVYPVTGSGGLPRLAYVLGGPANLLLRGRIEVRGIRLAASVEDVPDTPLGSLELRMDGGAPGYLVVSRDLCRRQATAQVSFAGHEGQTFEERIPLRADCG